MVAVKRENESQDSITVSSNNSGNECMICAKLGSRKKDFSTWIQCDVCKRWTHTECSGLDSETVNEINLYHCNDCNAKHGPLVMRRKSKRSKVLIDYAAYNEGLTFALNKSHHPHVSKFHSFPIEVPDTVRDLTVNPYIDVVSSCTAKEAISSRWTRPILVPQADLLVVGMELPRPREEISVDYIAEHVGKDQPIEVMDVLSQLGVVPGWNMGQWQEYFTTASNHRDRIRNVILLEVSKVTGLGDKFIRPKVVRDLDVVDKTWVDPDQERPQVTKYCLMSVKGSFTDFHIDFGGTSVYYTICSGEKIFLMFPPNESNLYLYTQWCLEPNQNYIWFPDYTKKSLKPNKGFKVTLKEGDLFYIPSGWIHCVYTPSDSVVIGGNFLTLMNMPMQLRIAQLEKDTLVPYKFRFPLFNKSLWLTSWYYYNHKAEFEDFLGGDKALQYEVITTLKDHLESHLLISKKNKTAKMSIPQEIITQEIPQFLYHLEEWALSYKIKRD
ncbi:JmjC domain-containing histone demethylation protein 1 [Scheffersomyces spartinae]|uniref:JmjC domain-containing histone demethylation protein 1 n=1 Tax=Scheffersomyces spartinae TaxID=45513 RepID=A0A9P7V5S6_9ASCO|nr:JmjC domain-containing histone demethylation protein 1 [Scheffersomyces spartinae]KAG7191765.1 JmjC domain-containing histone demethylation protein 1 [Scheffersomyces spartinae]